MLGCDGDGTVRSSSAHLLLLLLPHTLCAALCVLHLGGKIGRYDNERAAVIIIIIIITFLRGKRVVSCFPLGGWGG